MRMLQNTTRFVIVLLLACHAFEGQSVSECEIREYKRCIGVFLDAFHDTNKTQSLLNIYCNAYKQGIGKCLMSNLGCSGEFLDLYRFIIFQHMIVDDKLGVCSYPNIKRLEQVFHDKEEYFRKIAGFKELEADDFAPCTAKTNRYCATRLAKELMSNNKVCHDVYHFMDCYNSSPCEDKVYQDFLDDMKLAGKKFAQINLTKELADEVLAGC